MESSSSPAQANPAIVPATNLVFPQKFSSIGQFVQLKHGRTYVELQGPSDGVPLVFVHGITLWSFIWDDVVTRLLATGKFRVLTYDLYARGHSDVPDLPCDSALMVEQLHELILLFFPSTPVVLVGLSMGGAISGHFAATHPECLRRVLLLSPAGAGANVPATAKLLSVPFLGSMLWSSIGARLTLKNLDELRLRDNFYGTHRVKDEIIDDMIKRVKWMFNEKPGFSDAFFKMITSFDLHTLYQSWHSIPSTLPFRILWGDQDAVTPVSGGQLIQGVVPHCEVKILKDFGHMFTYEDPQLAFDEIFQFATAS